MSDNSYKDFLQDDEEEFKTQKDIYDIKDIYKTYNFKTIDSMSETFDNESEDIYKTYTIKTIGSICESIDDKSEDIYKKKYKSNKKNNTKKSYNTNKKKNKNKTHNKGHNNNENDKVNDKNNVGNKEIKLKNEYIDFNNEEINFIDFDKTIQYSNDEIYLEEKDQVRKNSLFKKKIVIIALIILGLLIVSKIPKKNIQQNKSDYNTTQKQDEYFIDDTDKRYLSENELRDYTIEELGYIRNEIFARHGYVFGENKYKDYFESQTWYEPDYSFKGDTDNLNKYEIDNIKLLLEIEKKYKQ